MANDIMLATHVTLEVSKLTDRMVEELGFKSKSEWLRMVVHKELGVAYSPTVTGAPTLGEYIREIVRDELSQNFAD